MNNRFQSSLRSIGELLDDTSDISFNIPIYQRPYVWGDKQIRKLLEDIYHSFRHQNEDTYFIGNTYVYRIREDKNLFDIVDGQQRFTTLWLLSLVLKQLGVASDLCKFLGVQNDLKLRFSIRREVESYLNASFSLSKVSENLFENDYVKGIAVGMCVIQGVLKTFMVDYKEFDLQGFATYIYSKVSFVFNIAPEGTDLNQLFVALGNSGIQLEQSDILKSKLLLLIEEKERISFGKIWEACENMEDYFENNVSSIFSVCEGINYDDFAAYNLELFDFGEQVKHRSESKTIESILSNLGDVYPIEKNQTKRKKNRCESIIDFNLLLIHTLRIYRKKQNQPDIDKPLDKKNLLEIFTVLEKEDVVPFFKLLWSVRYLFDEHIVKWRYDNESDEYADEEQKLRLTSVTTQNSTFSRTNKSQSALVMLQSVLYYTGGYNHQYWLTPFIYYLLSEKPVSEDHILSELEKIDNHMLPGEKREVSWELTDVERRSSCIPERELDVLNKSNGTSFSHYWFYKLEYVLWKTWNREDLKFKKFRITSKNSIEHVFPQKH